MSVRPSSKHCCVRRPQLRCWLLARKSSDLDSQRPRRPPVLSNRSISSKTFATSCHLATWNFPLYNFCKRKNKEIIRSVSSMLHNQLQPCNILQYGSLTRTSAICENSSKALTIPRMTCQMAPGQIVGKCWQVHDVLHCPTIEQVPFPKHGACLFPMQCRSERA